MSEELDMEAAALLSPSDPVRQQWETRVREMPEAQQAQWRALAKSGERLLAALVDARLPEGMESRLMGISEGLTPGQEMETAALLPAHDPIRAQWEKRIAEGAGKENGESVLTWQQLVHEAGAMRAGLVAAAPSEALLKRLKDRQARRSWWEMGPVVRWAAAALAAGLLVLAGMGLWRGYLAMVDRRTFGSITALVAAQHPAPPGVLVNSDDTRVVQAALESQPLEGMPPIIIGWRRGGTELVGGGVTTLGNAGARAYFTTWNWQGQRFTLFQFRPKDLGLREDFVSWEHEVPAKVAGGGDKARVYYWSEAEHHCGWALVTAGPVTENPFIW